MELALFELCTSKEYVCSMTFIQFSEIWRFGQIGFTQMDERERGRSHIVHICYDSASQSQQYRSTHIPKTVVRLLIANSNISLSIFHVCNMSPLCSVFSYRTLFRFNNQMIILHCHRNQWTICRARVINFIADGVVTRRCQHVHAGYWIVVAVIDAIATAFRWFQLQIEEEKCVKTIYSICGIQKGKKKQSIYCFE